MTTPQSLYTENTVCQYCESSLSNKRPQSRFCSNTCRYSFHNKQKQNRVAPMRFVNLRQTIKRAKYSQTITEAQRVAIVNFLEGIKNPAARLGSDELKDKSENEL